MLFSVIIPTYNRADLFQRTLDSVWQQTLHDYEVIVVDDGSTDGTLEQLRRQRDRIRLIEQSNKGPGAARNRGIGEARGDYVAFLDSDDIWFAWTLATFADLIHKHGEPAILAARLMEFQHDSELANISHDVVEAEAFADYFASFRAGYFVGSGMSVIKRDVLLASGGFTEDRANAEDHDLILRIGTAPGFVQITSPITLGWRRHASCETKDVRSTAMGVLRLIHNERTGKYPGRATRGFQRHVILTGHARPASLGCLQHGAIGEAWRVYWATLAWHLRQGRWRFLLAFPVLSAWAALRRPTSRAPVPNATVA